MIDAKYNGQMFFDEQQEDLVKGFIQSVEKRSGKKVDAYFVVLVSDDGPGKSVHCIQTGQLAFQGNTNAMSAMARAEAIAQSARWWVTEKVKGIIDIVKKHEGL